VFCGCLLNKFLFNEFYLFKLVVLIMSRFLGFHTLHRNEKLCVGEWVVGNDEEVVLGLRPLTHDNVTRFRQRKVHFILFPKK
jgi:hypothetical protein